MSTGAATRRRAWIALGANLGDRPAALARAIAGTGALPTVRIRQISPFYENPPVGFAPQPDFINACMEIETSLSPRALLMALKELERRLGRTPSVPNGPREIDLDLLWMEGAIPGSDSPTLPHPRMAGRAFVLVPLAAIAPTLVIPPLAPETIAALAARVPGREALRPVPWPDSLAPPAAA